MKQPRIQSSCRLFKLVLCLLIIVIAGLPGCAVERNIQGNCFYSSTPKLKVQVSDEFKYMGQQSYADKLYTRYSDDKKSSGKIDATYYIFIAPASETKIIKKAVIITTKQIWSPANQLIMPIMDRSYQGISHYKIFALGNDIYESAVSIQPPTADYVWRKWIKQNGYRLPECKMHRILIGITDENRIDSDVQSKRYEIKEIVYFEDISDDKINCEQWNNTKTFTDNQKIFINNFLGHSETAFKILTD